MYKLLHTTLTAISQVNLDQLATLHSPSPSVPNSTIRLAIKWTLTSQLPFTLHLHLSQTLQ